MNIKMTCNECGLPLKHICDEDFKEALLTLLTWVPEGVWSSVEMRAAFQAESARQGDDYDFEDQPFFGSQAWSYLIWNKHDARTFHAILNKIMYAAGIDPYEMANIARKSKDKSEENGR